MGWFVLIVVIVVIVGLSAIYPWALRRDRARAEERGPIEHPWVQRAIWIVIFLTLVATTIVLLFVVK